MKNFHCDHCDNQVYFENVRCVGCDHCLGYAPELNDIASLEPADKGLWRLVTPAAENVRFRLCRNYSQENICNWLVAADDPNPLCRSCRLTRVIPDLNQPGHRDAWYRLEVAKRRLIYSLLSLKQDVSGKDGASPKGLAFEFLADPGRNGPPVLTGHENGVITVNIAEADDVELEKRRLQMHEPYRTLLGHFRHEVGHYYWDQLIRDSDWIKEFRRMFGDERMDYAQSLARHYRDGPPSDWQNHYVSAYASSHPWEDWAEMWAHYLHMADLLETANGCGMVLRPKRPSEPVFKPVATATDGQKCLFDEMIAAWFSLTYVLNNLNRGIGLRDGYPFVLSKPAIEKLRFVHKVVTGSLSPQTADRKLVSLKS